MSDSSSDDWDPSVVSQFYTSNLVQTAASALVCYEYLITITDEINVVWLRKFSPVSVLLVSTRWAILIETILELLPAAPDNCKPILILMQICVQLGTVQAALFSALRVSAIWGRNVPLFAIVLALGLIPLATNIFTLAKSSFPFLPAPFDICTQSLSISEETFTLLVYVTRIPLCASDLLVLVLTLYKTAGTLKAAHRLNISVGIATCLVRDGTIYFFVLLVLNITQILTRMGIASPMSALVDIVPPLLISRFILNLRRAADDSAHLAGASPSSDWEESQFSAVSFRIPTTFVGNMGEPLDIGDVERHHRSEERTTDDSEEVPLDDLGRARGSV